MNIALDFDGTFTASPSFWLDFIHLVNHTGHTVHIVTARCNEKDGIDWMKFGLGHRPCDVIWCNGRPKREVVREWGIKIDIWIDDDPYSLINGSQHSPETLRDWRTTDAYGHPTATGDGRPSARGTIGGDTGVQGSPPRRPLQGRTARG